MVQRVLLLCLLTAWPAQAAIYHVNQQQGSDSNACSATAPCRSINGCIARMQGGDTCVVGGGTYDEAIYDWAGAYAGGMTSPVPSGRSASQPTTLRAAPGEAVWLRPSRLHSGGAAQIEFTHAHDIVVDGINVNLGGLVGYIVAAGKETRALEFRNMELTNSGHCGVQAYGEKLRFVNLHVHHNALGAAASQYGQRCHGFYVAGSNGVYDRLRVHDHGGYGLQISCDGCSGGAGGHNVVQNSLFYNNQQGGIVAGGSTNPVVNNLVYGNGVGIITSGPTIHNTVYGHSSEILIGGSPEVRDNIAIGGDPIGPHYTGSGDRAVSNLCSGGGFGCDRQGTAANVFVNAAGGDFHVRPDSQAFRTATDGTDRGVDFGLLATGGPGLPPPPEPLPAPRNVRAVVAR